MNELLYNDSPAEEETDIIALSENMLSNARRDLSEKNTLSVPIAELSTLGAGVSSLIPALNTVTQTTTIAADGLYRLANAAVGDTLKVAKNGNFWGAFKTADGASKFVQLQAAGPLNATTTTVATINPATMMMSVALYSIEKEIGNIAETTKQIISFLEIEQESEIEADIETLLKIVNEYKHNWDNEHFISSNHKLVLDIKRTARKNMLSYQKKVSDYIKSKQLIVAQNKVSSSLHDLEKLFTYYRLSLYSYSLSSLMEIMLSGNFKEEYVSGKRNELSEMGNFYRELFNKSSIYLEQLGHKGVESNLLKGLGTAEHTIGKFMGAIPVINKGSLNEKLQEGGVSLKQTGTDIELEAVAKFSSIGNPQTASFINKLDDVIKIYNHTESIYFNGDNIYLVSDN